jgi:hypothetical protein
MIFKIKHKLYVALASDTQQNIQFARLYIRILRSSLDISHCCKALISLFMHPCLLMRSFRITFFSCILPQVSRYIFHTQYPHFASVPRFACKTSFNTVLSHIILKCLVTPDEFQFLWRIDRLLPSIVLESVGVSRDCQLSARHDTQIHSAIYRERLELFTHRLHPSLLELLCLVQVLPD